MKITPLQFASTGGWTCRDCKLMSPLFTVTGACLHANWRSGVCTKGGSISTANCPLRSCGMRIVSSGNRLAAICIHRSRADASLSRSAVEMMHALTDLLGGNELVRHGQSRMSRIRKSLSPRGRRCFNAELGYANEQRCDAETSIAPAKPNLVSRSNGKDPLWTIARLHGGQAA